MTGLKTNEKKVLIPVLPGTGRSRRTGRLPPMTGTASIPDGGVLVGRSETTVVWASVGDDPTELPVVCCTVGKSVGLYVILGGCRADIPVLTAATRSRPPDNLAATMNRYHYVDTYLLSVNKWH